MPDRPDPSIYDALLGETRPLGGTMRLTIPNDQETILPAGVYLPVTDSGVRGTVVRAQNLADVQVAGDRLIRFNDGCQVAFEAIHFRDYQRFWVSGGDYRLTSCHLQRAGAECLMGGLCSPLD